jgi:gas vesicle protein
MADGYDRFENEGGGGGSFVMGLLTGTVLGAGLGMLFAPKSGSELRNQLSEQAGNLANAASEGYRRVHETAVAIGGGSSSTSQAAAAAAPASTSGPTSEASASEPSSSVGTSSRSGSHRRG